MPFHPLSSILVLLGSLSACCGLIYDKVTQLPGLNYDFVIVGGGTAGNVVANRLTENSAFSVLVLEAGVSNIGVLDSRVPALWGALVAPSPYSWNYSTTPQLGANKRALAYPRGHILGGSSSVNSMWYTRGSSDDFDRYANVTGDPGWRWEAMQPYFFKNEKWVEPADHHNTTGQFDPSVHSTTGINSVSLPGFQWPMFPRVIETTKEMPDDFPFLLDMNAGTPLGVGWVQNTVDGGERSSSALSYLAHSFIQRPNLHVLSNAQVSRVLPGNGSDHGIHFSRVEFSQNAKDLFIVRASKEIILSAGSVGSPHILLNSGVGDQETLAKHGIQAVADLPSVGQNFTDQPLVSNSWFVNSTQTYESFTKNATRLTEDLELWNQTKTGPLVSTAGAHVAWLRLDPDSPIFKQHRDPAAGINTPHIELGISNSIGLGTPIPSEGGNFISIMTFVVSPASRGSITLNTGNPFDAPLIDPAIFADPYDLLAMRVAVKKARTFLSANAWKDYVIRPLDNLAAAFTSDDALDAYMREEAIGGAHPVGSAAMSPRGATWGVVDPDLLLKKASGIRIIDASVMPFVPSCHTQAPTYAIAERGADLIKKKWQ
ncbi:aryl-alcohol oxidase [Mycena rebaudengoi]|nr:aryl-alcohol oxidase [Mycena rebaudengoi]